MSANDYPSRILNAGSSTTSNSYGGSDWSNITDALWRYMRRDFSDFDTELDRIYPRTSSDMIRRTVPWLYRLCRELATFYVRPPARVFIDPATGEQLPPEVLRRIDSIYRGAGVNSAMRTAHEHLIGMGNAVMMVVPVVTDTLRGVRILQPPPHYQAFSLSNVLSHDERDATEWWVRVPIKKHTALEGGGLNWATAYITRDEAYWIDGPKSVVDNGFFFEDKTNPLGRIPVVVLRNSEPGMGEGVFGPAPEDLLHASRSVCFGYTDVGHVARFQGFGQAVVRGVSENMAADIQVGPEQIIGLPDNEADFDFATPKPDLQGLQNTLDAYMRAIIAGNGMNPDTMLKSAGITALSKIVERADREVERRRQVEAFKRAEQSMYNLIRGWINSLNGAEVMPAARVEIEFREPYLPADPLHDAQATQMLIEMGLTSAIEEVAKRNGLTHDEARQRVERYRTEQAEVAGAVIPEGFHMHQDGSIMPDPPGMAEDEPSLREVS